MEQERQARPPLSGDRTAEVAVIGGGMAGVLTAYLLRRRGIDALVLEAGALGSGQTGRTSAKVTAQHGLIYQRLEKQRGAACAGQYASIQQRAVEQYRRLIQEENIACDWVERPAVLFSTEGRQALEQERDAARRAGLPMELRGRTELPFSVAAALECPGQAMFHPLKFLRTVAARVPCYEQTRVLGVDGGRVVTEHGAVQAEKVVFAGHFPFIDVPGLFFARMHQQRSYVLALADAPQLGAMYLGVGADGLSLRNQGPLLLLGGAGHRTGGNGGGGQYAGLRQAAARYFPGSREVACWSAQDCITLDGLPYIGKFAASRPHWYVATGFMKWGMTNAMAAAQLLTALIAGEEAAGEALFSPQRWALRTPGPLLAQSWQAAKGWGRRLAPAHKTAEELQPGEGGVVQRDGRTLGAYKDEQGRIFWVELKCPHLGCRLEWNPEERTWDCPCHGSRFDYRGNLLDGPANRPGDTSAQGDVI